MKTIHVAAAIILKDGCVLACQRGYGKYKGWWEFPGGKAEDHENMQQALVRECREELDCTVSVDRFFCHVSYSYPEFHLEMDCYLCALTGKEPVLLEHMDALWVSRSELYTLQWLQADLEVLKKLEPYLKK